MRGIDRPIFIVGVDHSGTSLLYRMLARHPEVAWFSQYSQRGGGFPGRVWIPFHAWTNRTGRELFDFTWRKREGSLLPEPREASGIWRRLIPRTDGFLDASHGSEGLASRVQATLRSELAAWRRERMLVKIPYLTRAMLLLDGILPGARFLHIVRDGKAVALSNRARFERRGHEPVVALRLAAHQWAETLEYVERAGSSFPDRLLTLRYEDFCTDVHGWLREAARFSGLEPRWLDVEPLPRTLQPTNDKWLRHCPAEDRRLLDDILGTTLARWGYEPFPDDDGGAEGCAERTQAAATVGAAGRVQSSPGA
jgi:hypothetical protein